jgi:agmatine/peptidylarginine deiminase
MRRSGARVVSANGDQFSAGIPATGDGKGVTTMKALAAFLSILVLALWCPAQVAAPLDAVQPQPANPYPNGLPAYMTPEEQLLPLPPVVTDRAPPSGVIYTPPEYAPCDGLFMSWQAYTNILTQMTVFATNATPPATVWMVVDSASEQTSVTTTLTNANADMNYVQFIIRITDTVWIRDYGPRFITEDGNRAIIDHTYNRPRPNDDAFNDYLAQLWGIPQYDLPLVHGGGNFHLFANGDAFMSSLIVDENPSYTAQQIKDLFLQYENVNLTIYTGFPTSFDSTRHIDMWMFPVGDNKVIIGQYSVSSGAPYTITENAVADLTARGYTVFRTPGWNTGGTHYTYTNAVVLNNQVFISKFNVAQDADALATFQAAFAGYTIRQIDNSDIIHAAGAMHCIVMHVPSLAPDPIPHAKINAPNGGELWIAGETHDILWTASDDVGVTSVDLLLSTDSGATYPQTIAAGLANTGTYPWMIPSLATSHARVKVVAHDGDGNAGEDASDADFTVALYGPQVVYSNPLDADPGWPVQGQWAFGQPTGGGGAHGHPDPTSGATGLNVYGVNLSGDYSTTPGGPWYVTMGPVDLSAATHAKLRFQRWLNSDYQPYAYAMIEVSNNGTNWTQVWANGNQVTQDNAWSLKEYDISTIADEHATVYIRWGYRVGSGAYAYSGWNIDDIQLVAIPTTVPGDLNCDGTYGQGSFGDINPFVLLLTNPGLWQTTYPGCPLLNGDINGDGSVNFGDINPFVALLTGK